MAVLHGFGCLVRFFCAVRRGSSLMHRSACAYRFYILPVFAALVLTLSACSDSGESSNSAQGIGDSINAAEVIPDDSLANPILLLPVPVDTDSLDDLNNANTNTDESTSDSNSEAVEELSTRLETQFIVDAQQIVPTSGWICDDVFGQKRTLYFYPEGVLDADRKVLVERTLIADSSFNDANFFYSISGPDSLLTTSTILGEQGNLLSAGQQHDIHTIRFAEVSSSTAESPVTSFTAQSVLRGKLVCALFDLR